MSLSVLFSGIWRYTVCSTAFLQWYDSLCVSPHVTNIFAGQWIDDHWTIFAYGIRNNDILLLSLSSAFIMVYLACVCEFSSQTQFNSLSLPLAFSFRLTFFCILHSITFNWLINEVSEWMNEYRFSSSALFLRGVCLFSCYGCINFDEQRFNLMLS